MHKDRWLGSLLIALGIALAANSLLDPVTLRGRYRLAQSAVRAMGLSGELVLTASPYEAPNDIDGDRVRHELFTLAGTLCDEVAGTEISVSVRFPQPTERSGLMPSVHKVPTDADSVASG